MTNTEISKEKFNFYFLIVILIALSVLFFNLIKGYLISLLFGGIFAVIFYPLYKRYNSKFNLPGFNAFFIVMSTTLLVIFFSIILGYFLFNEVNFLLNHFENDFLVNTVNSVLDGCSLSYCDSLKDYSEGLFLDYNVLLQKLESYMVSISYVIFEKSLGFITNLFIFFLAFYYFLKDGESFLSFLKSYLPLTNKEKNDLILTYKRVVYAVFGDTLLIAFIQGFLVGIMFWILDIRSPVLWGFVTSFFALIPAIGTGIVWVPGIIYLIVVKKYLAAVVLLIWGVFVVGLVDNVLRPILIKNKIKIHSFLILLSIFGGISVYGILGIFIGPIIISILFAFLKFFKRNSKIIMD